MPSTLKCEFEKQSINKGDNMNKCRQSSVGSRIRIFLSLIFAVAFMTVTKAQDYTITTAETWTTNQTLSTNVIVDNGGTLTINAGVTVGFNYADVNADTTGDFRIEVKAGGKLIVNGTLANPVIFQGAGATPPAYATTNKWWQGLVMSATTGSSINFLTIQNAALGVNVAGAMDINGLVINGALNGITVNNTLGGVVNINVPTLSNITNKGIVVNSGTTNIRYATLSNITDNGIEINAPNVTVNWASVVNASTGLYNSANATSTVVSNSSFTGNKKSGLFNLDGTVTVTNSKFNSNTFHGVVNSSGTLTLSQADISNNTSRGLLLAGAGTSTVKNVTDTANGNVGVDVITLKQVADVLVPAGTAETTMPSVSFLYSNIYSNSKTSTPANLQVRSLATSASPVADFTTNWWGVSTGIIDLVSSATAGALNYANWRTAGAFAVVSQSNLTPTKSITASYPLVNQRLLVGENCNIKWSSVGNIPYVIVRFDIGAGIYENVVPNTGAYTYAPTVAGATVLYLKSFSADSNAVSASVSPLTTIATGVFYINRPIATDTLRSNADFTVRWVAPATVTKVTLTYSPSGAFPNADNVVLANSVDATSGYYTVRMPSTVVKGTTAMIQISDVTPNVTNIASLSSAAFKTFANPPWSFATTGTSMNIAVDTLINAAANPNSPDPAGGVENTDTYLGAFWTNNSGQQVCVGYVQGIDVVAGLRATPDPRVPGTISNIAASSVGGNAATHVEITTTAAAITAAGLLVGDFITVTGSNETEYNGTFAVTAITGNKIEIQVPVGAAFTSTTATWLYNNISQSASAGGGASTLFSTRSTAGLTATGKVITLASTGAAYPVTAVTLNTNFTATKVFASQTYSLVSYAAAPAPRAATHTQFTVASTTGLQNGLMVVFTGITDGGSGDAANYNPLPNGLQISHVTATTFEVNVAPGVGLDVATASITKHDLIDAYWISSQDNFRSLTIWGDDPLTASVKEGPAANDAVSFKLYKAGYSTATTPDGVFPARLSSDFSKAAGGFPVHNDYISDSVASVTFQPNSTNVYFSAWSRDGYGQTSATLGSCSRTVSMTSSGNWYLFSTNINPVTNSFLVTSAGGFTNSLRSYLVIAKDGFGNIYWPAYNIDQIDANGGWNYSQAYYMKVSDPDITTATFAIGAGNTGSIIVPESSPIPLNAGWNFVPYLRNSDMNIATALSSISKYLVIVKQDDGKVYWPAYSINEIGNMTAGKGYMVKVTEATTLIYPSNSYVGKAEASNETKNAVHFVVKANSDNSSVIAILADALNGKLQVNDEVGVFNADGVLVGSSVYNGGNTAVVVWGLESGAKKGFGMKEGEAYTIKVWSKATGKETVLANAAYTLGTGLYSNNGVSVISKVEGLKSAIPTEYAISQNYPNPFNPSTIISYALPTDSRVKISIYNILGQLVRELVNTDMKAGYHQVNFNAAGLASGIYMYQIDAGNFHMTKKMNLLK